MFPVGGRPHGPASPVEVAQAGYLRIVGRRALGNRAGRGDERRRNQKSLHRIQGLDVVHVEVVTKPLAGDELRVVKFRVELIHGDPLALFVRRQQQVEVDGVADGPPREC